MHLKGKTPPVYVNHCNGIKRPVLDDQRCLPHAVRVKYLVVGHLKSVAARPELPVIVGAVIVVRQLHRNARPVWDILNPNIAVWFARQLKPPQV